VDGASPCWTKRFTATFPARVDITANGGLRGLHAIPSPDGKRQSLLVAVGGPEARVVRIDVESGYTTTVDQDIVSLLQKKLGNPDISGSLFAYNDMLDVDDPDSGEHTLVMGLEAMVKVARADAQATPMWFNFVKGAHYIVRHPNGTYDVFSAEDSAIRPADGPPRVSTRTLAISPFDPSAVFLGGFDANSHPVHDTAWALTGSLATLLRGAN
jgi:hypothetical protein